VTDIKKSVNVRIGEISVATDAQDGAYVYTKITLTGTNRYYIFFCDDFKPVLTEDVLANSTSVDIWYNDTPINGMPHLVALQLVDPHGALGTKYVTD